MWVNNRSTNDEIQIPTANGYVIIQSDQLRGLVSAGRTSEKVLSDKWRDSRLQNWVQGAGIIISMLLITLGAGFLLGGATGVLMSGALLFFVKWSLSRYIKPENIFKKMRLFRAGQTAYYNLENINQELSQNARLEIRPQIYVAPSAQMSAFTVGKKEDAVIVMTTGLLDRLDIQEVRGVLAHELAHVKNDDIQLMLWADTIRILSESMAKLAFWTLVLFTPLIMLGTVSISITNLMLLLAIPGLSFFLQMALSRTRELRADMDAVWITGNPRALASALVKIENQQHWIQRLFMPGKSRSDLLRSHPNTKKRVRQLLQLKRTRM